MKQKPMTRAELERLLEGMDLTEGESDKGWWETFSGADFGAAKARALLVNDTLWRLKWTKEKPTEPGWYWYKGHAPGFKLEAPWIVLIESEAGELAARWPVNGYRYVDHMKGEWCGPLEVPE